MFWAENIGVISTSPLIENSFEWELPNCFACQCKQETEQVVPHIVSSPWFSVFDRSWRLALVRNGERREIENVGLFLWLKSSFVSDAPEIAVNFFIFGNNADIYKKYYDSNCQDGYSGIWDFMKFKDFSRDRHEISRNGILQIRCMMEEKTPKEPDIPISSEEESENDADVVSNDGVEEVVQEAKGGVDLLAENLKRILIEEEDCDVVLKVGDREFKAHRKILKARSPVFASMFKHDTKEKSTGEVDIPDCSAAAFEVFLLYLYTGSVDKMSSDNVCELYYAGDKYQMNDLKSECVEYMKDNLSVKKFCAIMTLSLQHRESNLQEKATNFFCSNVKKIIKTVEWQEYLRDCPTEANELFIKVINA